MNNGAPATPGLVDSLRALGDGLLASVQDRVRLVGIELQEEKARLIQTVVWISGAIVAGVMTLAMASFTLAYLFWETARTTVLVVLTGFYGTLFIGIMIGFRRQLARQPQPLAATLEEIEEDRRCVRAES